MSRLISFGCSLVFGDELSDNPYVKPFNRETPSKLVWQELLANDLKIPHINRGFSGASNNFIYRDVFRFINNIVGCDWVNDIPENFKTTYQENDVLLIQWSGFDRIENYDPNSMPDLGTYNRHIQLLDMDTNYDIKAEKFIMQMQTLQSILELRNIKYYFCFGLDEPSYAQHLLPLRANIPYINTGYESFITFARKNKFKMGEKSHPLEQAQIEYKNIISKVINV